MTATEYMKVKLARYGYKPTAGELDLFVLGQGLTANTVVDLDNEGKVKLALIKVIPELLALPDVSEGDLSIKYKPEQLRAYLVTLCESEGVEVPVQKSGVGVLRNRSNRW